MHRVCQPRYCTRIHIQIHCMLRFAQELKHIQDLEQTAQIFFDFKLDLVKINTLDTPFGALLDAFKTEPTHKKFGVAAFSILASEILMRENSDEDEDFYAKLVEDIPELKSYAAQFMGVMKKDLPAEINARMDKLYKVHSFHEHRRSINKA